MLKKNGGQKNERKKTVRLLITAHCNPTIFFELLSGFTSFECIIRADGYSDLHFTLVFEE